MSPLQGSPVDAFHLGWVKYPCLGFLPLSVWLPLKLPLPVVLPTHVCLLSDIPVTLKCCFPGGPHDSHADLGLREAARTRVCLLGLGSNPGCATHVPRDFGSGVPAL